MTSVSEQTATWQLPDGELAAEIVASQARMCAEYARQLDLVAEADQRGLASVTGYRTTDQMLTGVLHISQREAKARVAQATLDIPRMRAALAAGEINPEHAFVIGKVLAETPDWVSTDQRAIDEQQLVTLAQQAIPSTVDKVADRLRAWWDADGKEPEDRDQDLARPRREFRYRWTKDGRFKFSGEFDHDAGRLTEDLFVTLAKPHPKDEHGNPDPRTTAERQGDAIVAALDLAARAPDLPTKSGERAVATVTIPYADLLKKAGDVILDNGELLTAAQLRRLLCNSKVYPAVLDGEGQCLDLGRSKRTATPEQRRALAIRDRGCTRPGCGRSPKWTTPHHVTFWATQGGETNINDLALARERDHLLLHHGGWDIEIHHGVVYWIPPAWQDPERKPLRNTAHDPPRSNTS